MTRTERQNIAVKKWIANKGRGACAWCTGAGKTRVALIAIKSVLTKNSNISISIIVPTDNLKNQWKKELLNFNLLQYCNVEVINSAIKHEEKIDFLILDECHRYLSDSFIKIFNIKHPNLILGLSATFVRLDNRHKLLESVCPIIDTVTVKEALKNGWLSNYREYKIRIAIDNYHEYQKINESFINSFSMFEYNFDTAMKCLTNIVYRRTYAKNLGIDSKTMDAITFTWHKALRDRKGFINNHPKKIELARKILEYRKNTKAITFSGTIKQAEKIKIGKTIHSGKTKKNNRITLEEFESQGTGVINTSKALDEGADIPGLNLAIILAITSSKTQKLQRIGRVIRKEADKFAEIFTLIIPNTVEENWFLNSSEGSSYIEIDEDELMEILDYNNLNKPEKEGREIDVLFRI